MWGVRGSTIYRHVSMMMCRNTLYLSSFVILRHKSIFTDRISAMYFCCCTSFSSVLLLFFFLFCEKTISMSVYEHVAECQSFETALLTRFTVFLFVIYSFEIFIISFFGFEGRGFIQFLITKSRPYNIL